MSIATLIPEEETMSATTSKSPADGSFRLARFIAVTLLDPTNLEAYLMDPEAAMAAAGLTERERLLLTKGTFEQICSHVYTTGPGPAPNPQTDDGGPPPEGGGP